MNRLALQQQLKALVPTRGMYYFWLFFLCLVYLSTALNNGPQVHILLYFILVYFFAYLGGSLLMDVLVKPVALLLPAMRGTLPWSILAAAAGYSLLCAVPMMVAGPAVVLADTGLTFTGVLLLGMALFQGVVLVCFRLTSSILLFFLFMCLFIFGANPYLINTFEGLLPRGEGSLLMSWGVFLACTVATFMVTRRQDFRRRLSGKTVLTFADMGSPARSIRAVARMKLEAMRREATDMDQTRLPAGNRFARLKNRELAGFLDEIGTFYHRTNWKYALLNIVLFTVMISISNGLAFGFVNPEMMLILPLFIASDQVYTFFWRRFSPMLPISRERHFRIGLYKCALLWVGTVLLFLALLLGLRLLHLSLPAPANALVEPFAALPLKTAFYFAMAAPVFSWIFIFIRGFVSYFILTMIFVLVSMVVTLFYFDTFLQLNPVLVVLLTLFISVPFILQCRNDCYQSDLIRSP